MQLRFLGAVMALALPVSVAGAASAQEVIVTPYFWMASLKGDVATLPALPPVEVDDSFGDIFDELQFGFASAVEVRGDRWAFIGDFSYIDTGSSTTVQVADPAFISVGLGSKSVMGSAVVAYRVSDSDSFDLDVYGGVRFNWQDNELDFTRINGTHVQGDDDESWFDPIVGVRGIATLNDKWYLTGMADIGGFGIGSDFTWQLYAAANYRINDRFSLLAGYRYYDVDYENDGFVWDVVQQGPIIGGSIRF